MNASENLEQYILIITQFVAGDISASKFETSYLSMFKNETEVFPEHIYDVLNNLFLDVEAYCSDPELRDDEDLDENDLLSSAKDALSNLT